MNLLEHYISNDYKLTKLSTNKAPTSDTEWYKFEGTIKKMFWHIISSVDNINPPEDELTWNDIFNYVKKQKQV